MISYQSFATYKVSKGILTHLMAAVALTWSRERCGISPLDAVVSRPGVSIFIVVVAASPRCKVKEPSRGFKWEDEGEEEGKGEVEKVNRGGPILLSLIMDFPRLGRPHQSGLRHSSDNNHISIDDVSPKAVLPPSTAR